MVDPLEKKAAAHMSARERAQQALATSAGITHDLLDMRGKNDRSLSKTDPRLRNREKARMTKREAAQQRKREKAYERSRKRANDRSARLSSAQSIEQGSYHRDDEEHKPHKYHKPAPLTAAEHRALGKLPPTRKHAMGAAHDSHDSHSTAATANHLSSSSEGIKTKDSISHLNQNQKTRKDAQAAPSSSLSTNEKSHWIAFIDEHTAYTVYYNEVTKECSWNPPKNNFGYRWLDIVNGEEPPAEAREKIDAMSDPEGLGAEWMSSMYQEPSIARAVEFRRRMIFRGGESRLSLPLNYLGEMGIGILLYFKFLLHLIWTFVFMSIIVSPVLFSTQTDQSSFAEMESFVYRLTGRSSTSVHECLRADVSSISYSCKYVVICFC